MARNKDNLREWRRHWRTKPENKAKHNAYQRLWKAANREYALASQRAYYRQHRKKMLVAMRTSREIRLALVAGSPRPDTCEACGSSEYPISFDHCHENGRFRGWLCEPCNKVIGFARDDVTRLRKLTAYLERNHEDRSPQLSFSGF